MSCAMILIFFSLAACSLRTVRGTRDESKEEKFEVTLEDGSKGNFTRQEIIIYHFITMRETPENLKLRFAYLEARVKFLVSVLRTPDAYKNDIGWDYENMTALEKEQKLTKIREIKKRKLVIATKEFLWTIKRDAGWKNFPIHNWILPNITSELRRRELQALTTKEELDWAKGEIDTIKIMVEALKFIENDFEEIKELFEEKDQRFKDALSGC